MAGEVVAQRRWRTAISVVLVGVVAGAVDFTGIAARDVVSDEYFFSGMKPRQIESAALEPGAFVAHMPLAYVLRWTVIELAGALTPTTMRIHAALGGALAAVVLSYSVTRRLGALWGLFAGLLLAFSPILSFHAQESSNYSLTTLFGALGLEGVLRIWEGRPGGRRWLAVALLLGLHNGLFFSFTATALVLAAAAGAPESSRRKAFAGAVLAAAPALSMLAVQAAIFVSRMGDVPAAQVFQAHADPASSASEGALRATNSMLREYVATAFLGYAGKLTSDPLEVATLIGLWALPLAASLLSRGRSPERAAATVWAVAFLAFDIARIVFIAETGRSFTTGARAFLGILPCFVVVLTGTLARRAGSFGLPAASLLIAGLGATTLSQNAQVSRLHREATELVVELYQPGDVLLAPNPIRARFPRELRGLSRQCLKTLDRKPRRMLVVRDHEPGTFRRYTTCKGDVLIGEALPYRVEFLRVFQPPPHAAASNAYLSPIEVVLLTRSDEPPTDPVEREHGLWPSPRAGLAEVALRAPADARTFRVRGRARMPSDGAWVEVAAGEATGPQTMRAAWPAGQHGLLWFEVDRSGRPAWVSWLPASWKARADRPIYVFGPLAALSTGAMGPLRLVEPAMRDPLIPVGARLALTAALLSLVAGLAVERIRRLFG
jgi:hypothetical protein